MVSLAYRPTLLHSILKTQKYMTLKHFHEKYQGILNKCWKYLWWGVNCSDDAEKPVPENVLKTGLWIILALMGFFIHCNCQYEFSNVRPLRFELSTPLISSFKVGPSVEGKSAIGLLEKSAVPLEISASAWHSFQKKSTNISSFCCTCLCMCLKKTVTFDFLFSISSTLN